MRRLGSRLGGPKLADNDDARSRGMGVGGGSAPSKPVRVGPLGRNMSLPARARGAAGGIPGRTPCA